MDQNDMIMRLRDLSTKAGENYYERIQIAESLLQDKEWVKTHYRDAFRAADHLQACYFHDLCGMMTIWDLMHIYRKFPKQEDWIKYKYNLGKMHELTKTPVKSTSSSGGRRTAKIADLEKLEEKNVHLEKRIQTQNKTVIEKDERIKELEAELLRLQKENARLQGRVQELETMLDRVMIRDKVA